MITNAHSRSAGLDQQRRFRENLDAAGSSVNQTRDRETAGGERYLRLVEGLAR